MDSNLIDSAASSERLLAQPILALSHQLKYPGEKNPQFLPSVGLMPPSGLPTSPLGPSSRVPAGTAALPDPSTRALSRCILPAANPYLCFIKKKKKIIKL